MSDMVKYRAVSFKKDPIVSSYQKILSFNSNFSVFTAKFSEMNFILSLLLYRAVKPIFFSAVMPVKADHLCCEKAENLADLIKTLLFLGARSDKTDKICC